MMTGGLWASAGTQFSWALTALEHKCIELGGATLWLYVNADNEYLISDDGTVGGDEAMCVAMAYKSLGTGRVIVQVEGEE